MFRHCRRRKTAKNVKKSNRTLLLHPQETFCIFFAFFQTLKMTEKNKGRNVILAWEKKTHFTRFWNPSKWWRESSGKGVKTRRNPKHLPRRRKRLLRRRNAPQEVFCQFFRCAWFFKTQKIYKRFLGGGVNLHSGKRNCWFSFLQLAIFTPPPRNLL